MEDVSSGVLFSIGYQNLDMPCINPDPLFSPQKPNLNQYSRLLDLACKKCQYFFTISSIRGGLGVYGPYAQATHVLAKSDQFSENLDKHQNVWYTPVIVRTSRLSNLVAIVLYIYIISYSLSVLIT